MEGFAEIRKQPRAAACLNEKFQFYYCMIKAFIHRQMVARRFVSGRTTSRGGLRGTPHLFLEQHQKIRKEDFGTKVE